MGLPTILIVHGAWHTAAPYEYLVQILQRRGYETLCPTLSSCKGAKPPTHTLADDVEQIRGIVSRLIDEEGKDVVVLAHSYGGAVTTEACFGWGKTERSKQGKAGGITRLVYMASFLPQAGQGLISIFGGQLPGFIVDTGDGFLQVPDPVSFFYSDLPSDEASYWATRLVQHPKSAQFHPVSREAWRDIPVTYLKCEADKAAPPEAQQSVIDSIVGLGVTVDIESCNASHSPFLSMPQTLANIVSKIASAA